jgi:alkanesulfonate monooxygenase SsuD/methylene tetrahydromethanopterin reductase-like flavin-dependent oxidoreductase (luciferase family)
MGQQGLGLAVGFKPVAQLKPAVDAFREGRDARSEEAIAAEPARRSGTIALMRPVVVGDTDAQARGDVEDDLLRLGEAIDPGSATEATRPERRAAAREQFDAMMAQEVMVAGSADHVADTLRGWRQDLRFDLFLANVYAMGASVERVHATMRALAGPVRDALGTAQAR